MYDVRIGNCRAVSTTSYFNLTVKMALPCEKEYEKMWYTVDPLLQAAASNFFDEITTKNLLSKNWILLKASI